MRLLTIAYNYPPIRGPEATQTNHLLNHLKDAGVQIDLVTRKVGRGNKFSNQQDCNIDVFRTPSLDCFLLKGCMRVLKIEAVPDAEILWSPFAYKEAERLLRQNNYDWIYTRSVPFSDHLVGLKLKKKYGLPWVAHFSDPWTESLYVNYQSMFLERKNQIWERNVIEHADKLVFTSEETKQVYIKKYGDIVESKAFVHKHTYDETIVNDVKSLPKVINEKCTVAYVGNFYGKRTPEDVISAASKLLQVDTSIVERLQIVVYGKMPTIYQDRIKNETGGLVLYKGEISYLESQRVMWNADYLLSIDAPSEENIYFPSKLVEYFAYEVPIIAITAPKGTVKNVAESNGHIVVANGDVEHLSCVFEMIAQKGYVHKFNTEVYTEYAPNRVAKDLIDILGDD